MAFQMDKGGGAAHTPAMVPDESVSRLLNARTAEDSLPFSPCAFSVVISGTSQPQRRRRPVVRAAGSLFLVLGWLGLVAPSLAGGAQGANAGFLDAPEILPWDKPGSELVGSAGDPEQIHFAGNAIFPTEALRKGLLMSPGYLLGSHHLARRAPFLSMLQQKLLQGYKAGGFPEPQVTVTYDEKSKQVQVRIVEGQRYYCGQVKVSGVSPAVADALVERLTKPPKTQTELEKSLAKSPQAAQAKKEASGEEHSLKANLEFTPLVEEHPLTPNRKPRENRFVWEPAHPAGFAEAALNDLELETRTVLAEHGFFFPKFNLHPELAAAGLANLVVEVTELGPPGELSAIEVTGNRKNSKAELLQFLGLKPGMRITRELLEAAEQKLWQSGRFRYYELKPESQPQGGAASNQIRLRVKVVEWEALPKLTEPLPPAAQAMLRLDDWLSGAPARPEEDAVMTLHLDKFPIDWDVDAALSPRQGVLLQVKDSQSKGQRYCYSLLMATNTVGLFAPARGSKLLMVNTNISVEAHVRLVCQPPEVEQRFELTFAAGWNANPNPGADQHPPLQLDLTLAPAVFLCLAEDFKDDCKLAGNLCSIASSNALLSFDAASGRLRELRCDGPGPTASLRFETNGFDRALRNLQSGAASLTNQFMGGNPLTAFVGFFGTELARLSMMDRVATNLTAVEREQAVGALCQFFSAAVLEPLDEHAKQSASEDDKTFSIPPDELDLTLARNNLFTLFSGVVFAHCNEWFPKYSWPWTMARESVLLLASHGEYVDAELNRLISSESTGPLGCLALAAGLSRMNSPAARTFATQGLVRLRAADFQKDCRLLLEGDSGLAKTVANMARVLSALPPEQLASLVKALPPAEGKLLQECVAALRAQPQAPLATSLSPALNHYWDESLRSQVRAKLLDLARQSSRRL